MKTLLQSFLLSLFTLSLLFLIVALGVLALNERFIDDLKIGWTIFLVLPLALSIPATILGLLQGTIMRDNLQKQGTALIGLLLSICLAPIAAYLVRTSAATVFEGSGLLITALTIGVAFLVVLGAFRIGSLLARIIGKGDGRVRPGLPIALLILLALVPPVGSWLSHRPIRFGDKPCTVIFCMDGANWAIIDRLTSKGGLPTLTSLQREGVRYDMESISPLMSPILWTTIASGVSSDRHGVHNFYAMSSNVKSPRLWDMVEQNGGSVGLSGWPVTWPPREVNGWLIPSLFARGPETHPKELQFLRELAMREKGQRSRDVGSYLIYGVRAIQYGVRISTLRQAVDVMVDPGDFLESLAAKRFLKLRIHSDVFMELWERYQPEFVAFYNNTPDVISHYFWKYYEPELFPDVTGDDAARYGDMIPKAYRQYDHAMGRILHFAPDQANVVVVSDHGLEATETQGEGTIRLILTEKLLQVLKMEESIQGINLASRVFLRPSSSTVGRGSGLLRLFQDTVIEESGESIFKAQNDEWGNVIIEALKTPDLEGKHILFPGEKRIPVEEIIQETHAKVSGEHNPNAILLFKGERVRSGEKLTGASILDVAPTVLYLMGYPIEEKMEGRLLESIFIDGYVRNNRPEYRGYELAVTPEAGGDDVGNENLKATLKSLGYFN